MHKKQKNKNKKNSSEYSNIHLYMRVPPVSLEKVKIVGKFIILVPPNISKKVDCQVRCLRLND